MFLSPEKIVEYCDVHHGMKVVDLGSSIGQYSLPLAQRVGKHGTVYAIDIQKDLLSKLSKEARAAKIENLEVICGDIEKLGGTKLKDESVDRVFVVNTLFQVEDKDGLVAEAKRILKKGGKVIFIDWKDSFGGLGPHSESVILEKEAIDIFEKKNFIKEHSVPAGDHHYGIIFIKQ